MRQDQIILLVIGLAFLALGAALGFSEKVRRWGLNRGRARIWISLLGEDRALKLTQYFFGPLVFLLGVFCVVGVFVSPPTPATPAESPDSNPP